MFKIKKEEDSSSRSHGESYDNGQEILSYNNSDMASSIEQSEPAVKQESQEEDPSAYRYIDSSRNNHDKQRDATREQNDDKIDGLDTPQRAVMIKTESRHHTKNQSENTNSSRQTLGSDNGLRASLPAYNHENNKSTSASRAAAKSINSKPIRTTETSTKSKPTLSPQTSSNVPTSSATISHNNNINKTMVKLPPEMEAALSFPPGCPVLFQRRRSVNGKSFSSTIQLGIVLSVSMDILSRDFIHEVELDGCGIGAKTERTEKIMVEEEYLQYAPSCPVLIQNDEGNVVPGLRSLVGKSDVGMNEVPKSASDSALEGSILFGKFCDPSTASDSETGVRDSKTEIKYSVLIKLGNGRYLDEHDISAKYIKFNQCQNKDAFLPVQQSKTSSLLRDQSSSSESSQGKTDVDSTTLVTNQQSENKDIPQGEPFVDLTETSDQSAEDRTNQTNEPTKNTSVLASNSRILCQQPERLSNSPTAVLKDSVSQTPQKNSTKRLPKQVSPVVNLTPIFSQGPSSHNHKQQGSDEIDDESFEESRRPHKRLKLSLRSEDIRHNSDDNDTATTSSARSENVASIPVRDQFERRINIPDWLDRKQVKRHILGDRGRKVSKIGRDFKCSVGLLGKGSGSDPARFPGATDDTMHVLVSSSSIKNAIEAHNAIEDSLIEMVRNDQSLGRLLFDLAISNDELRKGSKRSSYGAIYQKDYRNLSEMVWMYVFELPCTTNGKYHGMFLSGQRGNQLSHIRSQFQCSVEMFGVGIHENEDIMCNPYCIICGNDEDLIDQAIEYVEEKIAKHMKRCHCSYPSASFHYNV